jgi:ATP-dependent DNA ligase
MEAATHPAAIFAFDLLALEGKDFRQLSLLKRKTALQRELKAHAQNRLLSERAKWSE